MTSRAAIPVTAILLFIAVFFYRFNALGGSFGGFDNDHFLQLALAKQVEAGAQPLRDFSDAVSGGWPSLTYEFSALAQRWMGDSFQSEAALTVTGVAVAAVLTFVAGAAMAPWPWALAMALLSVMLSPKLYTYPKVLVLAVAALLIVTYARRPRDAGAAALGACTAVAFLFRHDYAVYCAAGFAAVMAARHIREGGTMARRAAIAGAVALALVLPALIWIQAYAGLGEYVRNALEISAREANRTRLNSWPAFSLAGGQSLTALLWREENTRGVLYYTLLALPWIGAAVVIVRARRGAEPWWTAALAGLSVLAWISAKFFLRGNLDGRFAEVAPAAAVLTAALLGAWTTRGLSTRGGHVARMAVAVAATAAIATCIVILQNVPAEFLSARLDSPVTAVRQAGIVYRELQALPGEMREHGQASRMEAADYVHRCTKPTDRVLVFAYAPEVAVFAERLFAGGRAVFAPFYYARDKYSYDALNWLAHESVPIMIAEPDEKSELYEDFPILADYIRREYQDVGSAKMSEVAYRVFVKRSATPTGRAANGLPCFS